MSERAVPTVAYVVREGRRSCPVGCGEDIILVKCLPTGRLLGWCWACEVSMPIPLPADYRFEDADIDPRQYAPEGLEWPTWDELEKACLTGFVIRTDPMNHWFSRAIFGNGHD